MILDCEIASQISTTFIISLVYSGLSLIMSLLATVESKRFANSLQYFSMLDLASCAEVS